MTVELSTSFDESIDMLGVVSRGISNEFALFEVRDRTVTHIWENQEIYLFSEDKLRPLIPIHYRNNACDKFFIDRFKYNGLYVFQLSQRDNDLSLDICKDPTNVISDDYYKEYMKKIKRIIIRDDSKRLISLEILGNLVLSTEPDTHDIMVSFIDIETGRNVLNKWAKGDPDDSFDSPLDFSIHMSSEIDNTQTFVTFEQASKVAFVDRRVPEIFVHKCGPFIDSTFWKTHLVEGAFVGGKCYLWNSDWECYLMEGGKIGRINSGPPGHHLGGEDVNVDIPIRYDDPAKRRDVNQNNAAKRIIPFDRMKSNRVLMIGTGFIGSKPTRILDLKNDVLTGYIGYPYSDCRPYIVPGSDQTKIIGIRDGRLYSIVSF